MTDIDRFWEWFTELEETIFTNIETDPEHYAFAIHERLTSIHPDLVFDIPFEMVQGKREFIVSADGDASLFGLVEQIVGSAPTFENWIIHNLRPRTNQQDQAIDLDGLYLEYEDIFYTIEEDELPLSLTIYIRNYDPEDNRYVHGYFLLLDTLLGEHDAVTYTETIAILPYNPDIEAERFLLLRDHFDRLHKKNS